MRFPVPLVGVAEQLFFFFLSAIAIASGWGVEDGCVVVRLLYLGGRPGLVAERAGKPEVRDDWLCC